MIGAARHAGCYGLGGDAGNSRKSGVQQGGIGTTALKLFGIALQLRLEYGGAEFRDSGIRAEVDVVIPGGPFFPSTVDNAAAAFGKCRIIGHDDAALTGRKVLGFLKAEDPGAPNRSRAFSLPGASPRVARVLNQLDPMLFCQRGQFGAVGHGTAKVHRHDGPGPRRDGGGGGCRAHAPGFVHVDKNRSGPHAQYGGRGGHEGIGGHNNLIAGPNFEGFEDDFESSGATGAGDTVAGPLKRCVGFLKGYGFFAVEPFPALKHAHEGFLVGTVENGPGKIELHGEGLWYVN